MSDRTPKEDDELLTAYKKECADREELKADLASLKSQLEEYREADVRAAKTMLELLKERDALKTQLEKEREELEEMHKARDYWEVQVEKLIGRMRSIHTAASLRDAHTEAAESISDFEAKS